MINVDMKEYNFYLYGDKNAYGQPTLSEETQGVVKMAIYSSNKSLTGSVDYTGGDYVGLTRNNEITDKYVIQYGDVKLKVLYTIVCPRHLTQVMMSEV